MVTPTKKPFVDLQNDLSWFYTCPEIRLLHVATSGADRPLVIAQVAMSEFHAFNRGPFFLLEDAHTKMEDGWTVRSMRLREIHEERRKGMPELAPLSPVREGMYPLSSFAGQLADVLAIHASQPLLDGAVLVLAPTVLDDAAVLAKQITDLARVQGLARVRFIVIELGDRCGAPLYAAFGEAFLGNVCVVDPAARRAEAMRKLGAGAAAPLGASPEVAAGFAGPRDVVAPPRFGKQPWGTTPTGEAAAVLERELGPQATLAGPAGALLRKAIKSAAFAAQEQRWGNAVVLQGEAFKMCTSAGLFDLACVLETALGGYLLQAGYRPRARMAFETASKRAESIRRPDLVSQALLGFAALLVLDGELEAAVNAYKRAGEAAEHAGLAILAVEAFRTAGQVALRAGAEQAAVVAWKRALSIAAAGNPSEVSVSSAPATARALAKVLQNHGSHAAAAAVLADADRMERATEGESNVRG